MNTDLSVDLGSAPETSIYPSLSDELRLPEKIYISGALTNIPNPELVKAEYERTARFCETLGFDVYLPHTRTDPVKHADLPASEVFIRDERQIRLSSRMVAFLNIPSTGVGIEIPLALAYGVQVIVLRRLGLKVSRMALGCPGIIDIIYRDIEDALDQISHVLALPSARRNSPMGANRWRWARLLAHLYAAKK